MNILTGKELTKKKMADITGVEPEKLDLSLTRLSNMGWLRWKKVKGKYKFTLYSEPVEEIILSSGPR